MSSSPLLHKVSLLEANVIKKNFRKARLRVALCYPNVYRVGMSSLAVHIIYNILNSIEGVLCERFFFLGRDVEPLSLEESRRLIEFDVILFTISYEIDLVNVINMLKSANIPILRKDREGKDYPIIGAGGIVVMENPRILEEIMDILFIGDAEVLLPKFIDIMLSLDFSTYRNTPRLLSELAHLDGICVPMLLKNYDKVKCVFVNDLDKVPYPVRQVVLLEGPKDFTPIYGRSFLMEISRGCPYWCRFCLLSYIYKPCRMRSISVVKSIVDRGLRYAKSDKVVLISSAIGNYPYLIDLLSWLVEEKGVKLSIPSMRIDKLTYEIADLIHKGGQRTMTFAPETASERLMEIIGKGISFDELFNGIKVCREVGFNNIKLYFMVGLPGERMSDIRAIVDLIREVINAGFKTRESVRVAITPFIPKPHTPFQWLPMERLKVLKDKIRLLRKEIGTDSRVRLTVYNPYEALIQAILSKGDRRLCEALIKVDLLGGSIRAWRTVIQEMKLDGIAYKHISPDEELPWDLVETNVPKSLLKSQYEVISSLI
ncbi:MAG: hypothetical protein DRJ66_02485 [Thermoprotei archaeon]|nr:MAG: hypothetical protein DRJ66_02485 [Thermoprotei archaeon]